jgi:hypothetical protein
MNVPQKQTASRTAGGWLAAAAFLLAAALMFHGALAVDLETQMKHIAEGAGRWAAVHGAAAAALSAFAVAGVIVLSSGTPLTAQWWTLSAWAVVTLGALWTVTTALAEASVVSAAAVAGDQTMFEAWWRFAEAKANGFAFLALAFAVIAANEAAMPRPFTPSWASWIAALAGAAAFSGWVVGAWLGIRGGSAVWVTASLVMCLWLIWLGVALARAGADKSEHMAAEAGRAI